MIRTAPVPHGQPSQIGLRSLRRSRPPLDWARPSLLFGMLWAAYLAADLLSFSQFRPSLASVIIITLQILAFRAGGTLAPAVRNYRTEPTNPQISKLASWSLAITAVTLAYSILAVRAVGLNPFTETLQDISRSAAQIRYTWMPDSAWWLRLMRAATITAPLLGGALLRTARTRSHLVIAILAVASNAAPALLSNQKSFVVLSIAMAAAGYLWASTQFATAGITVSQDIRRRSPKRVLIVLIGLLCCVFPVAIALRYGVNLADSPQLIWSTLSAYAFGPIYGFTIWLQDASWLSPTFPDSKTFESVSASLGFTRRMGGTFEILHRGDFNHYLNVFTIFRSTIQDFSLFGSLAFFAAYGMAADYGFGRVRRGDHRFFPNLLLLGSYSMIFYSPFIHFFAYTVSIVGLAAAAAILSRR